MRARDASKEEYSTNSAPEHAGSDGIASIRMSCEKILPLFASLQWALGTTPPLMLRSASPPAGGVEENTTNEQQRLFFRVSFLHG
jgi:hypothetical protein